MGMLILVAGLLEAAVVCLLMHRAVSKKSGASRKNLEYLEQELQTREDLVRRITTLYDQMVDVPTMRARAEEFRAHQESLKAERGRITITQAELETVENRLRELEEIERELEASGLETKEELNILTKKRGELSNRHAGLQQQITESFTQMDTVMEQLQLNAQVQERVAFMRAQLLQTQTKIDELLVKLEEGNEQYFILKRRYDALDIEYAQLYEKFSAAELEQSQDKEEK